MNTLYYGDNLDVLREHVADESVDLIYLDPPFNSNATYNVLFKAPAGQRSESQIEAFEDTWTWGDSAARAFDDVLRSRHMDAASLLRAMNGFLRESDLMAYLAMMAVRLIELHRVLKSSGTLYLHCDPTTSHYLRVLLDSIFIGRFRAEIIWKRSSAHNDTKQGRRELGRIHDTLLAFSKGSAWTWNPIYTPYDPDYLEKFYRHVDPQTKRRYRLSDMTGPGGAARGNPSYEVMGVTRYWRYTKAKMEALVSAGRVEQRRSGTVPQERRYLDDMKGVALQDVWTDLPPISPQSAERLGYPTQKPLALLERVVGLSSNPGDVVLDPFCGCGTTIHAAEKLGRQWCGIDITHLAVSLIERRIKDAFPAIQFGVVGTPADLGGARDLATRDKYQFQWWAVSLVDAVPYGGKKKGADRGIDGIRWVRIGPRTEDVEQVIVSVKAGETVGVAMVRDLVGVVDRERAFGGLFLSLAEPTREMTREAATAGFTDTSFGRHAKIQIYTIRELMAGVRVDLPPLGRSEGFRRYARERGPAPTQTDLDV